MSSPPKTLTSTTPATIKFLCSYGGKIIPRPSDGQLRYVGGLTRVVSVPRNVSFSELMSKLKDLCGHAVLLRCQLPTEDLDILVSIKSDEDLASVIEEYDKASTVSSKELKIRAILSPPKSQSMTSLSSSSPASSASSSASSSPDLSPSARTNADPRRWSNRKPPAPAAAAMQRNLPRRVYQYKVMGDCYHNYYPACHSQATSRPPRYSTSYLSPQHHHSNLWH